MEHICVFAGTTEGKKIVHFLDNAHIKTTACVATEFGEIALDITKSTIRTGRMDEDQMSQFFSQNNFSLVIDATHPFAEVVTENIKTAANRQGIEYLRVNRGIYSVPNGVYVESAEQAAQYLNQVNGNVLLTTGSKTLGDFTQVEDYQNRLYPRVLPMDSSIDECAKHGYKMSNIIAMQGPFSAELNAALLRSLNIKLLVTKDSGAEGGMYEKVKACEDVGVQMVIIKRPAQHEGLSLQESLDFLRTRLKFETTPKIFIIGMGPGKDSLMTREAEQALQQCDAIIGSQRLLEAVQSYKKKIFCAYLSDEVTNIIQENSGIGCWAIIFSGDIGFYSGAKKLYSQLSGYDITPICGISSPIYLAAKLNTPWQDMMLCSMHGKTDHIIQMVIRYKKVFTLLGGKIGVKELCTKLCDFHLGEVTVSVGENLTYPDEKITTAKAQELVSTNFTGLCCAVVFNPNAYEAIRTGIPDEQFIREPKVPMTKSEIRAVLLSKLALSANSVAYDIGAGTGSVSVEMALQAFRGTIYAIEKKPNAIEVIRNNIKQFCTDNIEVVEGTAPIILEKLPPPTHIFIGGSCGNMKEIIERVLIKNPFVRIVVTTVTLESLTEVTSIMQQGNFDYQEVVQLSAAKSSKIGNYNLMIGQNPVYICTLQKLKGI